MVRAELEYNPYLLETNIKFNEKKPRINSHVEKYIDKSLQTWIRRIPRIFHDEMNGFDFELEFSGPKLDYEELCNSFKAYSKEADSVHFAHIKGMESRYDKIRRLDDFLAWLKDNENRHFDLDQFIEQHKDLLENSYSFITIQGSELSDEPIFDSDISVENIENTAELDSTDLTDTPILIYLSSKTIGNLLPHIRYFKARKDVIPEQLFFYIHSSLSAVKTKRIIIDLGIEAPQIVDNLNSPSIKRYFELFPYTKYIHDSIIEYKAVYLQIQDVIEAEKEKNNEEYSEIQNKLGLIEERISLLKDTGEFFSGKVNFEIPVAWKETKDKYIHLIENWQKKKTVITEEAEAKTVAENYNIEILKAYYSFMAEISQIVQVTKPTLDKMLNDWYLKAGIQDDYFPENIEIESSNTIMLPELSSRFMNIKSEELIDKKEDIVGMLLWGAQPKNEKVLVTKYYYQKWREYASEQVEPIFEQMLQRNFACVNKYFNESVQAYKAHIDQLIEDYEKRKKNEEACLSEDTKILQMDINWLSEFEDQLKLIARG